MVPTKSFTLRGRALSLPILAYLAGILLGADLTAQVVFDEILFDPAGADSGHQVVEILNRGSAPATIGGSWLSFKPAAWQFPKDLVLAPSERIIVHINRSNLTGADIPGELFTGTTAMRSLRREDAIGLFTKNIFSDAAFLTDFVEWGTGGQDGEVVAVEKGIWQEGTSVDVAALRPGSSIARLESGTGAAAWCLDGTPSLKEANADGCTRSQARSPVRLNEVIPGAGGAVELANAGTILEDLGGKWLLAGGPAFQFPAGTILLPGEFLLVLPGTGAAGSGVLHGGEAFVLPAQGGLALSAGAAGSSSTYLIDFVQWGTAGSLLEGAAVEAGLWPAGAAVDVADRMPAGSLASRDAGTGTDRWTIDNTPTPGIGNGTPYDAPVAINEVIIDPAGGEDAAIELWNREDRTVDLGGLQLCVAVPGEAPPACASLPAGTVLAAGGFLVVRLGAPAGAGEIGIARTEIEAEGGEVALLATARSDNPNNFLAYIRWGAGASFLEAAATASGLWPGGSIETAGLLAGASIAHDGTGAGPGSYRIDDSPSPGKENAEPPPAKNFVRSECNQDGKIDISDPIGLLSILFAGGVAPPCDRACDSNDDGTLDISDPIHMLGFLFLGTGAQKPPYACGADTTPDKLTCAHFDPCP